MLKTRKLNKREMWFIDRIGKIVYRQNTFCCFTCEMIYKNGLLISDEYHAQYCYDCESEMYPLKYFDSREEMLRWERQHPWPKRNDK